MTNVLLFVPGLLGSELSDEQGKVWPGSLWNGIVGFSDERFERLLSPNLKVGGIIERAAGLIDIYAQWIRAFTRLQRQGNYLFSTTRNPPTLYSVPYDWRLDVADSVGVSFAPVLHRIYGDWGNDAEIHVIAHSFGGLLARFYLQSGMFNHEKAFGKICTLTTFGTPHNGAPVALAAALGLHATDFMNVDQSKRLANDPRYPALYQLFPDFEAPVIWKRMGGGYLQPISLSDRQFAIQKLGLVNTNMDKAIALREAIDLKSRPLPNGLRTFLLIGTGFDTITHLLWDGNAPLKVETRNGGDGTVSIQGAYLQGFQTQFSGQSHVDLVAAPEARLSLQGLFDATGILAPGRLMLTVRDRSIIADATVHLRIHSDGDVSAFAGELIWERALIPPGQTEPTDVDFSAAVSPAPRALRFSGPDVEALMLRLKAPSTTGVYRIMLRIEGQDDVKSQSFVVRPN
jgi:phospholipase A1